MLRRFVEILTISHCNGYDVPGHCRPAQHHRHHAARHSQRAGTSRIWVLKWKTLRKMGKTNRRKIVFFSMYLRIVTKKKHVSDWNESEFGRNCIFLVLSMERISHINKKIINFPQEINVFARAQMPFFQKNFSS